MNPPYNSMNALSMRQRLLVRCGSARALRTATWLVPLLLGLLVLAYGQDDNWDLRNYHLYNPFALMNGKIGLDLAPGQWQSYFNPTLDLVYYGLSRVLPAPLAGVAMGILHGLNFVLLLALALIVLPENTAGGGARRRGVALLLALAGVLGPGFRSELGNTMGDNMTSLLVLGALLIVLRGWPRLPRDWAPLAWSGVAMGAGCGLKLTNATFAVGLCLALLCMPTGFWRRLMAMLVFGIGVLAGIGATAGHWYWRMAVQFGNPLFPQFNNIFHAPLAAPIGIGDTGWLPKGLREKVLWPFIFTWSPERVMELPLRQIIWPVLYLAMFGMLLRFLRVHTAPPREAPRLAGVPMTSPQRAVLAFFSISYLCWLNLFGIYRYLVPLELLAPLVLWLMMQRLLPAAYAGKVAAILLLAATAFTAVPLNWGHVKWARTVASAELPPVAVPAQSMVFTVHGDPPVGWMATLFPADLAFVSLGSGFPESPQYRARVASMMAARSGPLYVLLQEATSALAPAGEVLGRYGLMIDAASCRVYPAQIGSAPRPFRFCQVGPGAATAGVVIDRLDFRQPLPPAVRAAGLSSNETWGTWSTADRVILDLPALPRRFGLRIDGHAYGPNVGKQFTARVGRQTVPFTLAAEDSSQVLEFDNEEGAATIVIAIPAPTSPRAIGTSGDARQLGLGLVELAVLPR